MSGAWIRIGAVKVHLDSKSMNSIVSNVLGKKAKSITKDPDLRSLVGTLYVNQVTPFVPKRDGSLRESGRGTSDGRVYWSATDPNTGFNYAKFQFNHSEYIHPTTPGTHPHWIDYVQPGTDEWSKFIDRITPVIIRRFSDG